MLIDGLVVHSQHFWIAYILDCSHLVLVTYWYLTWIAHIWYLSHLWFLSQHRLSEGKVVKMFAMHSHCVLDVLFLSYSLHTLSPPRSAPAPPILRPSSTHPPPTFHQLSNIFLRTLSPPRSAPAPPILRPASAQLPSISRLLFRRLDMFSTSTTFSCMF